LVFGREGAGEQGRIFHPKPQDVPQINLSIILAKTMDLTPFPLISAIFFGSFSLPQPLKIARFCDFNPQIPDYTASNSP